ncbi:hypothetical protein [Kitasatospora sp. NPDC093679]|uniref:hypothetical protein n=1 Tax=Kitasatospora sp. NPDC093679 TaxID=3154983 RepID=UPI003423EEBF
MNRESRPLHDMGGAVGPADTAGHEEDRERTDGPEREPAPIGKGGTPNVAGSDEQQPEIAEGPVPGVRPDEDERRGRRSPVEIDAPGPPGERPAEDPPPVGDTPAADPERIHGHDPGAEPEDEGIPDLADGSPGARLAEDPQRMPVPGEAPVAAESFGVTGAEQAEGRSLDERLAAEEPEADSVNGPPDPEAGQLTLDDERRDTIGTADGETVGLGPEEHAVRLRRVEQVDLPPDGEPPGE